MANQILRNDTSKDELIEQNMGLIVRTVSTVTGRYVRVGHDDAFSVALSAFSEAAERYTPERGAFASYAVLVMRSRLLTFLEKENRNNDVQSLDEMTENGQDIAQQESDESDMREEIAIYAKELGAFGLTFDLLAEKAPKHADTRRRAVKIAQRSAKEKEIVDETYRRRKLPVRAVAALNKVSEKIVKQSKTFILSALLVFTKDLPLLAGWLKEVNYSDDTRGNRT